MSGQGRKPARLRLWPRSLAGQMILLVLAVLLAAQIAGTLFLADERKAALRAMGRDVTAERIESVLRLLAETPPELHDKVTSAASGGQIRFSLSGQSLIPEGASLDISGIWSVHGARLRRLNVSEIRASMIELDLPPWWHSERRRRSWWQDRWHMDDDEDEDGMRRMHEGHHESERRPPRLDRPGPGQRGGLFELSLHLADGRWLNVSHHMPPRPYLWALTELVTLVGSAIALVLIVVLMIRRITRPVRRLAEASDVLGRGADVPPLAEKGAAEIRHATRAFNDMNRRLKRFMKDRLAILAALSHDLRTPITTLRLRAEFIEDDENRGKILETLDEISEMTEVTLNFVREDTAAEETRQMDFSALVESVCEDLADQGKRVSFTADGRILASCRPAAIKRALRNLIENADKYGGGARVSLEQADGLVRVIVDDDGPGIPADRMEEVFQPFFRLEESRSRDTGGIGMGLAIARMIARGHGGDITMENRPGENRACGGLRATLTLPLEAA